MLGICFLFGESRGEVVFLEKNVWLLLSRENERLWESCLLAKEIAGGMFVVLLEKAESYFC